MSYKRELLMLGVPELDTRAFVRDGGGNIKPQTGGGSAPAQPSSTTQNVVNVPEYIRPYVESTLGRAQALTTGAQYQPYDPSQRFAEATPMQQQSYDAAAQLGPSQQLGQATGAAQQAITQAGTAGVDASNLMNTALGYGGAAAGLGAQYNQAATDAGTVGSFMSPYMQNVVDIQKQEAIRDYQKQVPELQAAATRAGAYGGSRQAIMQAEGQRNLMQNLGDIQGRGQQAAYEQALQSMQFGSQMGLQGLQTGLQGVGQGINAAQLGLQGAGTMLQGAGTLGQLGQTEFGQRTGTIELQNALGTQQQQQQQQLKDFDYQQYLDELNFPYTQLAFMSDMTRGLPVSQSAQTVYQQQPSSNAQLLGAGLQAFGYLNRAQGGKIDKPVRRYAEGGTVSGAAFDDMTPDESAATIASMSDQQLAAYARTVKDAVTLSLIQAEQRKRQNMRAPQGQIPMSTVAQDTAAAGIGAMLPQGAMQSQAASPVPSGGIAAFADGGVVMGGYKLPYDPRPQGTNVPEAIREWWRGTSQSAPAAPAGVNDYVEALRRGAPAPGSMAPPAQPTEVGPSMPPSDTAPTVGAAPAGPSTPPPQTPPRAEPAVQSDGRPAPAPAQPAPAPAPVPAAQAGSFDDYVKGLETVIGTNEAEAEYTKAMRQGLDDRQARIAAMEKRGQMDALIAAGVAMMNSPTMADALAKGSAAGFQALKQAEDAQADLQAGYEEAKDAQTKYELALKRDDRKTATDMYTKYQAIEQANLDRAQRLQIAQAELGVRREQIAATLASGRGVDELNRYNKVSTILKREFPNIDEARQRIAMAPNGKPLDADVKMINAYKQRELDLLKQANLGDWGADRSQSKWTPGQVYEDGNGNKARFSGYDAQGNERWDELE